MHTLRLIGIAVVFALTLSAATAAGASATAFQAAGYPAEVTGTQSESVVIGVEGLNVTCKSATLTGVLSEPTEDFGELAPTLGGCSAAGLVVTVAPEGCTLQLDATTSKLDVSCPAEKAITVTTAGGKCQFKIGTQTGLASDEYSTVEETPQTVSMKASNKEVKYTNTVDEKGCPLNGTGEKSNGTLSGKMSLKAASESGAPINMFVGALTATQLCEKAEFKTCGSPYKTGVTVEAKLIPNAVFEFVLSKIPIAVFCTTSTIKGTTAKPPMGGLALGLTLTEYSFDNCGLACDSVGLNTPESLFTRNSTGGGSLQVGTGRVVAATMSIICGVQSCTFEALALDGTVTGGAPATLDYPSVRMKLDAGDSSATCAGPLQFLASYKFTEPKNGGTSQMWLTG